MNNENENTRFVIPGNSQFTSTEDLAMTKVPDELLKDARLALAEPTTLSVPIGELSSLGAAISSLMPQFRTLTLKNSASPEPLYRIVNMGPGDVLKAAKDGKYYGVYNKATGGSGMAKLIPVDQSSLTMTMPFNPVIVFAALALFSIEKQLGDIAAMEKQIVAFLENEKRSEVEADIETLTSIVSKYKLNWDNEQFLAGNHKMTLEIRRTARKNMLFYQKSVTDKMGSKKLLVNRVKIRNALNDLSKQFKYYRLSLYSYSLASFLEIMLSGNFKEESILSAVEEIEKLSAEYRSLFERGSAYIEQMSLFSVEENLLKGLGATTNAAGKLIASIPKVKDGNVDEYLQGKGQGIKNSAELTKRKFLHAFASVSNPCTAGIVNSLKDVSRIYNHADTIFFDSNNLYLITD